jgi:hypothetical protein
MLLPLQGIAECSTVSTTRDVVNRLGRFLKRQRKRHHRQRIRRLAVWSSGHSRRYHADSQNPPSHGYSVVRGRAVAVVSKPG